jgi:hypothetical protein
LAGNSLFRDLWTDALSNGGTLVARSSGFSLEGHYDLHQLQIGTHLGSSGGGSAADPGGRSDHSDDSRQEHEFSDSGQFRFTRESHFVEGDSKTKKRGRVSFLVS